MKGRVLVFLQFLFMFLLTLPIGNETNTLVFGLLVLSVGGVVGVLALYANRIGNFNIRPDIKEECKLITHGIYKYIRHPMYLSVILLGLGMVVLYPYPVQMLFFGLLVIVLVIKMFYEESLWRCHLDEYEDYMKQTKRLIPFVF